MILCEARYNRTNHMPTRPARRVYKVRASGYAPRPPANKKNLRKTTAKGAYKKNAKKNMRIRRAPFVETKRRVTSLVNANNQNADGTHSANYPDQIGGLTIPNDDAVTILHLDSFLRMSHGFQEHNMIGDAVYSRLIKMKLQFRFPEANNQLVNPCKIFLIQGWCTVPSAFTANTSPTESQATLPNLRSHIKDQLDEYFDQREDFLRFRELTTSNMKILSWKEIKPPRSQIPAPPAVVFNSATGLNATVGAPPMINRSLTWKVNRKIHYSEGKAIAAGDGTTFVQDTQNMYPNQASWLPFAIIYNPDFARMSNAAGTAQTMTVAYNDIHYYSDS